MIWRSRLVSSWGVREDMLFLSHLCDFSNIKAGRVSSAHPAVEHPGGARFAFYAHSRLLCCGKPEDHRGSSNLLQCCRGGARPRPAQSAPGRGGPAESEGHARPNLSSAEPEPALQP